jgi:hypothetical protein
MLRKYSIALLLSLSPLLVACDGAIESQYKEQLVVGAFLFANEPVDSIVIHRTTPFGSFYGDLEYAVDSATVTLSDGTDVYTLEPSQRKGRYALHTLVIQPGKTYNLTIVAPNHQTGGVHTVHGSTIIPMPISISPEAAKLRGQVIILDTNQLSTFQYFLTAGPNDEPNRKYLLSVTPLDTTQGKITVSRQGPPVDTLALTHYSFMQTAPLIGVSPRLFAYYGPNKIDFIAIDTNWVDYQRQVFQANLSYQSSLNHIIGGLGVFASGARDTMTIFIKPKE